MPKLDQDDLLRTDYLTETLRSERDTQIEVFNQMILQLEAIGECRAVYHRLALVLLGTSLGDM